MRKDVPSVTVPTTLVCGVLAAAAVLLLAASTVEGLPGERAAAGFAARGGFPRLFGLQQNGASSFHSGGPPPTPPAIAAFKGCPVHPPPVPQVLLNANNIPSPLQHALEGLQKTILKNLAGLADPAVSVGVVYDQELIWGKGFGLVDPRDPSKGNATTDTIYRIGSITKLITDIMLMKLRDAGKVVLDDPVQKYVPAFTVQSPYPGKGLTWRSLASQVSGLAGGTPCDFFTLFEPIWNNACDITNEEAWRRISEQQVIAPMYTEPHYADSAYAIVGRALESVLPKGVTYEDYVTTEIFGPLGMGDSHFVLDNSVKTRLPPGYSLNVSIPDFVSHVDLNWARPTGQVYSTIRNLAKIASFFFVGAESNTIGIDPSSIREMLLPVFINPDMTGYGFPFEIYHTSLISSQLSSYWLRTKAGAIPGYTSSILLIPEIKLGLIAQSNNFIASQLVTVMLEGLLPTFEKALWSLQPSPPNPGNLTSFEGTYVVSKLLGLFESRMEVKADPARGGLQVSLSLLGQPSSLMNTTWVAGNVFRVQGDPTSPCLWLEAGLNNVFLVFQVGFFGEVVSAQLPGVDPFYGWTFSKEWL